MSPYSALTQIDWISDESRALTEPKWECVTCRLQPTLSLMAFAASKLLFRAYPCLASDKESAGSQGWLGCSEYEAKNFKKLQGQQSTDQGTPEEKDQGKDRVMTKSYTIERLNIVEIRA
ncbi:hypothetical protein PAAG_11801 [Paracoccidioides lutzii Pb01]|uniref:Uncharacterized protein n=1 Tax=Paracoccidioides lutzii (strain ATCC MYA-826 / Pb01) TaxID=502779 RepID=A0A0A2V1R9_PARBA|nr:hypothetical protein PAAG_11801 [Paracoccidioides lutzii Pb01]KGQ01453.1 hypothetical protein PAAG_11801 [Paracoccidioides lutzii Pb01]